MASTGGSDTSWSWTFGDGQKSTAQNPTHMYSSAGIFKVTLRVKNAEGRNISRQNVVVSQAGTAFTMAQTLSDGAQRTTLAFSGLALMTGNLEAQSFFPPGKVADYTGFQYLRDNDPDNMGHNTSFLTRVANNVIYMLNDSQFEQLKTLAVAQQNQINLYGYKRFPLMKAFRRLIDGDIPSGSQGLNLNSVKKASRELYILDGQISFDRAFLYANIIRSLDSSQKAYLDAMKGKGWNSWPDITNEQVRDKMQGLPQGTSVAVMTYASDLFSWYAGSVDADVYFCPERQGTYYGSFYIKDAPAIGHEGYSIDEQLTASAGSALCDSSKGYVTEEQAALISILVDIQKNSLYGSPSSNIFTTRTKIATLLRRLMTTKTLGNSIKTKILKLSEIYGDLDGENNYHYATVFTQVYNSLSDDQKTKLSDLRKSILSGTYGDGTPFDFTVATAPYLYSSVITDVSALSTYIDDTDYLFFEP
jgi:PKD repeat protein